MEVTASNRMGSMMLVAALILWSSTDADASSLACKVKCAILCSGEFLPVLCISQCIKNCEGGSLTPTASDHCDVGCLFSTCLDYHLDTKKFEVDVEKVGACTNSCSQECQKTYSTKGH